MSDDLVRQLRDWCRVMHGTGWVHLAESMGAVADRIEELEAECAAAWDKCEERRLAQKAAEAQHDELLEALEQVLIEYDDVDLADHEPKSLTSAILTARAAIAKAKEAQ